uniref:Uncharacterized protein n=1 Tax=Strongyloides venezuelensis TaxID=75913 RepID=A0A0K0FK81_STRVS
MFHNSECKYVEEDYYDEGKTIPNVSWVPIISRRDEKIKEAFDVLVKSEGNENEYIKKLNRIAEMLNISYDIDDKNFIKSQKDNLKNIKIYKIGLIEKNDPKNFKNNAFPTNIPLLTKHYYLYIYLPFCILYYITFINI